MSKITFLRVELEQKYIYAFRLIMLLAAWPFLSNIYFALVTGSIEVGASTAVWGESPIFYARVAKNTAFAVLFLWLGSFGSKTKSNSSTEEDTQNQSSEN